MIVVYWVAGQICLEPAAAAGARMLDLLTQVTTGAVIGALSAFDRGGDRVPRRRLDGLIGLCGGDLVVQAVKDMVESWARSSGLLYRVDLVDWLTGWIVHDIPFRLVMDRSDV